MLNHSITHTVRARHYYYGPKEIVKYHFSGSLAECKEYVKKSESETYYLTHNESGRPTYKIVRIDSLGEWARRQAEDAREMSALFAECTALFSERAEKEVSHANF